MTLAINSNAITAAATYSFVKNSSKLASSIEKLSSGLRINRAADDGPSLALANQLNSEALGLGRAVQNANDGVSMLQVADSSLDEAVKILQSIKTMAIQASQDGQTASSRQTIQSDIDKLLEEMDLIVKSTKYNDIPLLTGVFSDKVFQVGVDRSATLSVSLSSAQTNTIGHLQTGRLSIDDIVGGKVDLSFASAHSGEALSLKSINITYDNSVDNSMAALADAINLYSEETGISGQAIVEKTTSGAVLSGSTSQSFAINGINIGLLTTQAEDADNRLINAINNKTANHGITASITSAGQLNLLSADGRPIEVTGIGTALTSADAASISTFGYVQVYQRGAYQLSFSDTSTGLAVAFTANMNFATDVTTTIDSNMVAGSVLGSGSTLASGWKTGVTLSGTNLAGDISTNDDSILLAGSVLASGSIISSGSTLGGNAFNASSITTTENSFLNSDSIVGSGSVISAGTYLTNTIYVGGLPIASGTTLDADKTLSADLTLVNDMLLQDGSVLISGSYFTASSYVGGSLTLSGSSSLSQDMSLLAGSTIVDEDGTTVIVAGSTVGGSATIADTALTMTESMTVKAGSVLSSTSSLATGSSIGGASTLDGDHTASSDLLLAVGSILAANTVIKTGSEFTNQINTTEGFIGPGVVAVSDYTTFGANTLSYAMTLKSGSVLASGSELAANSSGTIATQLSEEEGRRLADLSVLTREDAFMAIELVDAALNDISRMRSNVGSIQDQFVSAVSHGTVTKFNLEEARSKIMDIDFAEETRNYTKMQLLMQTGIFATSQANAFSSSVLGLLQGGEDSSNFSSLINSTSKIVKEGSIMIKAQAEQGGSLWLK